jgi:hypothetical protein
VMPQAGDAHILPQALTIGGTLQLTTEPLCTHFWMTG